MSGIRQAQATAMYLPETVAPESKEVHERNMHYERQDFSSTQLSAYSENTTPFRAFTNIAPYLEGVLSGKDEECGFDAVCFWLHYAPVKNFKEDNRPMLLCWYYSSLRSEAALSRRFSGFAGSDFDDKFLWDILHPLSYLAIDVNRRCIYMWPGETERLILVWRHHITGVVPGKKSPGTEDAILEPSRDSATAQVVIQLIYTA
ncbi:hypothetical protein IW262DRAFT_1477956 [Armillaria fumosa]|nr:hypothetical protein IW262DRAFT_1477956 [Armillaria fumosa]